jgi:hypothetical protein
VVRSMQLFAHNVGCGNRNPSGKQTERSGRDP